jgi:hypothetical protein
MMQTRRAARWASVLAMVVLGGLLFAYMQPPAAKLREPALAPLSDVDDTAGDTQGGRQAREDGEPVTKEPSLAEQDRILDRMLDEAPTSRFPAVIFFEPKPPARDVKAVPSPPTSRAAPVTSAPAPSSSNPPASLPREARATQPVRNSPSTPAAPRVTVGAQPRSGHAPTPQAEVAPTLREYPKQTPPPPPLFMSGPSSPMDICYDFGNVTQHAPQVDPNREQWRRQVPWNHCATNSCWRTPQLRSDVLSTPCLATAAAEHLLLTELDDIPHITHVINPFPNMVGALCCMHHD